MDQTMVRVLGYALAQGEGNQLLWTSAFLTLIITEKLPDSFISGWKAKAR